MRKVLLPALLALTLLTGLVGTASASYWEAGTRPIGGYHWLRGR